MKCPKCNEEFDIGLFCPFCGTEVEKSETRTNEPIKEEQNNIGDIDKSESNNQKIDDVTSMKSKKNLVTPIVGLGVVIIILVICVLTINNPVKKWEKMIDTGAFDSATTYYMSHLNNGKKSDKVEVVINKKLSDAKEKYISREMDIDDVNSMLNCFESTNMKSDDISKLREYVAKLEDSRNAYNEAKSLAEASNYEEAIAAYEKVWEEDPDYSLAKSEYDAVIESYTNKISEEVESLESEEAKTIIEKALKIVPGNEKLKNLLDSTNTIISENRRSEEIGTIKEYIAKEDFENGLKEANNALKKFSNDQELIELANELENSYRLNIKKQVGDYLNNGENSEALRCINGAISIAGTNDEFNAIVEEINSYETVSLTDLDIYSFEKNGNIYPNEWKVGNHKTILGETDYTGWHYEVLGGTPYYEFSYLINGSYDEFKSILSLTDKALETGKEHFVKMTVYGDNIKIYESPTLSAGSTPVDVCVDVKNVNSLKIRFDGLRINYGLLNPTLGKKFDYGQYVEKYLTGMTNTEVQEVQDANE